MFKCQDSWCGRDIEVHENNSNNTKTGVQNFDSKFRLFFFLNYRTKQNLAKNICEDPCEDAGYFSVNPCWREWFAYFHLTSRQRNAFHEKVITDFNST